MYLGDNYYSMAAMSIKIQSFPEAFPSTVHAAASNTLNCVVSLASNVLNMVIDPFSALKAVMTLRRFIGLSSTTDLLALLQDLTLCDFTMGVGGYSYLYEPLWWADMIANHTYDAVVFGAGGAWLRETIGLLEHTFKTVSITKLFPTRFSYGQVSKCTHQGSAKPNYPLPAAVPELTSAGTESSSHDSSRPLPKLLLGLLKIFLCCPYRAHHGPHLHVKGLIFPKSCTRLLHFFVSSLLHSSCT